MRLEIILEIYVVNIAIFCFKVLSQEYCNTNPEIIKKDDCESKLRAKPVCEEFDGMWYLVVGECMYYKTAKKHCKDLGFNMSNIRSLEQFQWLASKACTDTDLFWAGPYRKFTGNGIPYNADYSNLPKRAYDRNVPDNPYWAHGYPSARHRCFVFGYNKRKRMTSWKCLDGAKFFCETKTPGCGLKGGGGRNGGKGGDAGKGGIMSKMSAKTKKWVIVIVSCVGCLLVVGLIGLIIVIYRRKSKSDFDQENDKESNNTMSQIYDETTFFN